MTVIIICSKSITFNTFLKSQAEYFIKKGLEVVVACSDEENLDFNTEWNYKINFPNKILDFFNLFNYLKIYKQIKVLSKKYPSGIFYLHTPLASHLFRICTFLFKPKIIYFVHGFRFTPQTNFLKNIFFKTIEKILSYNTNIFITINKDDHQYARHKLSYKDACYRINGVGLSSKLINSKLKIKNKKSIKKILVIAAYKKAKGYIDILKVAELLQSKKIIIECYGYGNNNKYKLIKLKKNISNINLHNFDRNLKSKIKNYDILIHLSRREGLPVSIMQCLLEGLPVICYNIRGNNDLIKDKYNGFFVKSYHDIINVINYLNLEEKLFNQIRHNASKTIGRDFSEDKINFKIYKIIKKYYKQ